MPKQDDGREPEPRQVLPPARFVKSPETLHRWDGTVRAVINHAPPGPTTPPSRVGVTLRVWDEGRGLRTVTVLMESAMARDFAVKIDLSANEVDAADRGRGLIRE